jgi:hypothetical protein
MEFKSGAAQPVPPRAAAQQQARPHRRRALHLIENGDGTVVEALDLPRSSFAGHEFETPWSTLQLAYFVGTAMWTDLTQPFTFAMPDSTRAS